MLLSNYLAWAFCWDKHIKIVSTRFNCRFLKLCAKKPKKRNIASLGFRKSSENGSVLFRRHKESPEFFSHWNLFSDNKQCWNCHVWCVYSTQLTRCCWHSGILSMERFCISASCLGNPRCKSLMGTLAFILGNGHMLMCFKKPCALLAMLLKKEMGQPLVPGYI